MNAKKWLIYFFIELIILLVGISSPVILVEPYFHYHRPLSNVYYILNNERSQNDGIIKHFDYDSIITGTSMAANFKTSEFDKIFDANSIKVCFSGGSYKEINDNLKKAFDSEHEVKYVLRCLDYGKIIENKDEMRYDLGRYPTYLYDKNPFNDVKYILNKELIYNICIPMLKESCSQEKAGGITSFDEYSNWNVKYTFGATNVLGDKKEYIKSEKEVGLTEKDCEMVKSTIEQNVTSLAREHLETTFYYFFLPIALHIGGMYENGTINKQIDGEKIAIEQMQECDNIKLYSFNNHWDITTNLDNYKDTVHYVEWINTEILHMICKGIGLLTKDNYEGYIEKEREFYSNYTYEFYDIE